MLYLTWLISIQVFSAAGRFWSSDLNLSGTARNHGSRLTHDADINQRLVRVLTGLKL